jgi:hypothetical protein
VLDLQKIMQVTAERSSSGELDLDPEIEAVGCLIPSLRLEVNEKRKVPSATISTKKWIGQEMYAISTTCPVPACTKRATSTIRRAYVC